MYKLKIGGHQFEVKQTRLDDAMGTSDIPTNIIEIEIEATRSRKEATLLHEILHMLNPEKPEREIGHEAEQLYQVLSENNLISFDSILGRE